MDGVTKIERDAFYQILLHCLPSGCQSGGRQRRQLALRSGLFRGMPRCMLLCLCIEWWGCLKDCISW